MTKRCLYFSVLVAVGLAQLTASSVPAQTDCESMPGPGIYKVIKKCNVKADPSDPLSKTLRLKKGQRINAEMLSCDVVGLRKDLQLFAVPISCLKWVKAK